MKKILLLLVITGSALHVFSQEKSILDSINFYGSLQVQLAAFNKDIELQENNPQMGMSLYRGLQNGWSIDAKLEFGLHLINGTNFNNDANSSIEFLANPFKKREVFNSRLAYFGIANEKLGSLTFGKQWGVYYDLAGYTDNFSLFGGSANGVWTGGTDGGWKGTGRADNSVQYRNTIGPVEIAAQTQLFKNTESYGLSLQYHIPMGLTIGAAYNDAGIAAPIQEIVQDIGNRTSNFIAGVNYTKGKYYGAFTFSVNDDNIIIVDTGYAVSLPSYGYEVSLKYTPSTRWSFEGGLNLVKARESLYIYPDKSVLVQFILGANYFITPQTDIYIIGRVSNAQYEEFSNYVNAFAFGFRYDFNFGWKKRSMLN
jgi:predicted porin